MLKGIFTLLPDFTLRLSISSSDRSECY